MALKCRFALKNEMGQGCQFGVCDNKYIPLGRRCIFGSKMDFLSSRYVLQSYDFGEIFDLERQCNSLNIHIPFRPLFSSFLASKFACATQHYSARDA